MEKFEIFISYRRDGGADIAGRIADKLNSKGYKVFYDVESLRSGKFNEQIFEAIDMCSDMLVVLPPNGLDRCESEDDWVRLEVAYAIKNNKNIIPILLRNFEFPKELPEDINGLRMMQGVSASSEYFDASISRIEKLLECKKEKEIVPEKEFKVDSKIKMPMFLRTQIWDEDIRNSLFCYYIDRIRAGRIFWQRIYSEEKLPEDMEKMCSFFAENAKKYGLNADSGDYLASHYIKHQEGYKNVNNIYLVPKRYKEEGINPQELMHEISDLAQTCFYNSNIYISEWYVAELYIIGSVLVGKYNRLETFSFKPVVDFCFKCYTGPFGYDEEVFEKSIKYVSTMLYDGTKEYKLYEDAARILNTRVKLFLKYFQLISMFMNPLYKGKKIQKYLMINYKYLKKNKVELTKENQELFEKLIKIFGAL